MSKSTNTTVPAVPRLNGYSHADLQVIFGEIATSANVLREFLSDLVTTADGDSNIASSNNWYIAKALAERIGALADLTGSDCVGGLAAWMLPLDIGGAEDQGADHG